MKPQKVISRTAKESHTSTAENVEIIGRKIVEADQDHRNINMGPRKQLIRTKKEKDSTIKMEEVASLEGSSSQFQNKDGVSSALMLINDCLTQQNNSEEELLALANREETQKNMQDVIKVGLKRAISPHSVQINNNKEIARQETYEQTPIETQLAESPYTKDRRKIFTGTGFKELKELDNLQSVRDVSEDESRVTNRTSQGASLVSKRLEPTMQGNLFKDYSAVPMQYLGNRRKQRSFKTKAFLKNSAENTKDWEMDFATGQITVKYHQAVNSVRSSNATQKEAQKKTIDTENKSHVDQKLGPRNFMIRKAGNHNNTLTSDSATLRVNSNDWTQKLPSTLAKDSVLASLELLDSPNALAQQIAKVNQTRFGMQEKGEANNKFNQQIVQNIQTKYFMTGSQESSDNLQKNFLAAPGRRYLSHKRIQSAQTNTAGFKSRSTAGRVDTGSRSVNASNNFAKSRDQRQSYKKGREIVDRSGSDTFQQLIMGRNVNPDWVYAAQSSIHDIFSNNKKLQGISSNRTQHASNSPKSQATQSVRHLNGHSRNLTQSYNQHKLAESLLAEEEQMAKETDLLNELTQKGQDPETLLRRFDNANRKQSNKEVLETLFKTQKYDSKQNILLAKNPLIIRRDIFTNQKEFNAQTAKSIIEILDKQSLSSQINSNRWAFLNAPEKVLGQEQTNLMMRSANEKLRLANSQETVVVESEDQHDIKQNLHETLAADRPLLMLEIEHTLQKCTRDAANPADHQCKSHPQNSKAIYYPINQTRPQQESKLIHVQREQVNQRCIDFEEQLKSLSLYDGKTGLIFENTNVGDIQIMKDQSNTNLALFNFLGKLQIQQAYQTQQSLPVGTSDVTQKRQKPQIQEKRPKPNLNQAAVNLILQDQNKKRRLWSSSGIATKSRDLVGLNRLQDNDARTKVIKTIQEGLNNSESCDEMNYGLQKFSSRIPNNDSGQASREQVKTALEANSNNQKCIDDGNHFLVQMEIEMKDRIDVDQSQKNFDFLTQTNAKVSQSIEITQKTQENINITNGQNESSKAQQLFEFKVATKKVGDQLKNDDYSCREDLELGGLVKSKSFGGPNLLERAQFKHKRKRCQSAYQLNEKETRSDGNNQILKGSQTTQIALQIKGNNLYVKNSKDETNSKSLKRILPPSFKELQAVRLFAGDNSEALLPDKKYTQSNAEFTTETRGYPKSPFSQAEDPTPLEYLTRLMPPAIVDYHQEIVPQDFTGAIKNHMQHTSVQKFISPAKQGIDVKDKNFSTVQLSRRKIQETTLSDTVNNDVIIFNPISQKGSILENRSKESITNGIQTVTLSATMQQPSSRPAGIQLNIPLQNQEAVRSSKEFQSTLTVNTRSPVVKAHTNNKNEAKSNKIGRSDVVINEDSIKILSRQEPTMHLTQQLSAPSTAKITEDVSHIDTATQRHKIISPESQMGQLYQKTKRPIYQKTKTRQQNLLQQKTGESYQTKTAKALGVTYRDFNSNLNFDMKSTDFKIARPVRPQSYKNWKQQSKVKQKSINITHQNQKKKYENRPLSNISDSQLDYIDCVVDQKQQRGITNDLPSTTQILITTIENMQERPTQLATKPPKQERQSRSTVKSYIFSASEQQLVLAELQDLPSDFMAGTSNHQASRSHLSGGLIQAQGDLNQTSGVFDQAYRGITIVNREQDFEPQQVIPVKILHQKGLISRKKGLALVKYPQSFTQGPRQIIANHPRSKRPVVKKKPIHKHFMVSSNAGITQMFPANVCASNESPPLQVVNSQKMILMQRSKANVVELHQKHTKGSPKKQGKKITLGVSPDKDPVFSKLNGHFGDDYLKSDSEDAVVIGNPNTGFSRPSELIQNLNDQSNHITEEGAPSKDIETKRGTQQSAKYCERSFCKGCPLQHRALSSLKNSKEAKYLTRNIGTPIGTLLGFQALIQDPLSSSQPPAQSEDGNTSIVNSSNGRRGVMSRAGSFSKPDRLKLSPAQENLFENRYTAAVNIVDQAMSSSKRSSFTTESQEREKLLHTHRNDDQNRQSIDSSPIKMYLCHM